MKSLLLSNVRRNIEMHHLCTFSLDASSLIMLEMLSEKRECISAKKQSI